MRSEHRKYSERQIVSCDLTHEFKIKCDEHCFCIMKKIVTIYEKAGFPIIRLDLVRKKLTNLISDHKKLFSYRKKTTTIEEEKRKKFDQEVLSKMFEILPSNIEQLIEQDKKRTMKDKAEDILFLKDQRGPRVTRLGSVDTRYKFCNIKDNKTCKIESTTNFPFLKTFLA